MVKKNKRRTWKNASRKSVYIITAVFIIVHTGFFFSGFIPDDRYKKISEFRSPQTLSLYKTISLIRWEYSPKEEIMEVEFDISNILYGDGRVSFSAFCENNQIDSQIVCNREDKLIVQLHNVKYKKNKRIRLSFSYIADGEDNPDTVTFYHTIGYTDEVAALPVLSEEEYGRKRIDYDIAYYQGIIDTNMQKIQENNRKIEATQEELSRLKEHGSALTTDELLNISTSIQNNEEAIRTLDLENRELERQNAENQETIGVLQKRRADYD